MIKNSFVFFKLNIHNAILKTLPKLQNFKIYRIKIESITTFIFEFNINEYLKMFNQK